MADITHYYGIWPPGTRTISDIVNNVDSVAWATTTQPSSTVISDVLSGLSAGNWELEWVIEQDAEQVLGNKVPLTIEAGDSAPEWVALQDQTSDLIELPQTVNYRNNVTGTPEPVVTVDPPKTGFDIVGDDVEASAAAGSGFHSVGLLATNTVSSSSTSFYWTINEAPSWNEPLPQQSNQQADGGSYDLSLSLASAGYPTTAIYGLVTPPAGFSIDADGKTLLCAPGTAINAYTVNVTVDNGQVAASTINWTVTETNAEPNWDTPVDDRTDEIGTLPQREDFTGKYSGTPQPTVTISPPVSGFSLDGDEVVAADTLSEGVYPLNLRATNSEGSADESFTWTIDPDTLYPIPPKYNAFTSYNGVAVDIDPTTSWQNIDGDNSGGDWTATGMPPGYSIDISTGRITGVSNADATFPNVVITYTVNSTPYSADPTSWAVIDVPSAPEGTGGGMNLNLNLKI